MTNKQIYNTWQKVCQRNNEKLLKNWDNTSEYTKTMLKNDDAVLYEFAAELGLSAIGEYYSLDAVFYHESDVVSSESKNKVWTRTNGNWLKRIRIAFEHENAIDGAQGAYQEICHLITVKAENKVLVGYLANHTPQEYAEDFQSIIKDSGTKDNVLLILGYKNQLNKIEWCGFELTENGIINY